jgi:tetratricopeptide (TPR) repeat protein
LLGWLAISFAALMIGVVTSFVQEPDADGFSKGLGLLSHGGLLSLAFAGIGGLVGFLFGIPRRLSQPAKPPIKDGGNTSDGSPASQSNTSDVNTNLEQVSDWLTKIILGAGLTQLTKVPGLLKNLGDYLGGAFDNNPFLPLVIVIGSLVFGFFAGYLMTQLFLVKALIDAERAQTPLDVALTAAKNFEQTGQFSAATATLEAGLKSIRPDTPKEVKRDLYEKLTYNLLYEPPPDGFQKAIRYADEYASSEPNAQSARIWSNLAAALGQKYKWDRDHGAAQSALDETRQQALDAARKAIAIEPGMKNVLRTLWNPNDPTKVQSEEDDWEVFFQDPDFKKLLD